MKRYSDYIGEAPLAFDRLGNLYLLESNGTTIKLDGIGYNCEEKVIGFGCISNSKWLCTNKNLVLFDMQSSEYHVKPLPQMPYQSRMDDYSLVFDYSKSSEGVIAIQGKASEGLLILEFKSGVINERVIETDGIFFSILISNSNILLFGMLPRIVDYEVPSKWGKPLMLALSSDKAIESVNIDPSQYINSKSLSIEAIVDCLAVKDKLYAICPVIEEIDDIFYYEEQVYLNLPSIDDYSSVVILEIHNKQVSVKELINGCTYLGVKVSSKDSIYTYFSNASLDAGSKSVHLVVAVFDMQSDRYCIKHSKIVGLSSDYKDSKLNYFRAWINDEKSMYYGTVGIYTDAGEKGFLITSKNGLEWEVAHNLYDITRS